MIVPPDMTFTRGADVLSDTVRKDITALLQKSNAPGFSLAVIRPDAEHPEEFFGWGKRTEDGDPVLPSTTFNLASVTKAFTATAIGLLIDDFTHARNATPLPSGLHELTWDTKIRDLLPDEWKLQDAWTSEKASIRDLLSHTSGMPRHDSSVRRDDSPWDVVQRLRHLRPAFELREHWSYHNPGYMLATALVERFSLQPHHEFVTARILRPLGMTQATYVPSAALAAGTLAETFTPGPGSRRIPLWATDAGVRLNAGPGGLIASARDMARWARFWLGKAGAEADKSVPPAVRAECVRPHAVVHDDIGFKMPTTGATTYGFGWFQSSYKGHNMVWHSGGNAGISTMVALFPAEGLGVVALANAHDLSGVVQQVIQRVVDELFGVHPTYAPRDSPISPSLDGGASSVDALPSPRSPRPGANLPLSAFAGTYFDDGYGTLELCAPPPEIALKPAAEYDGALADFAALGPLDANTLYAAWPRIFNTHVLLAREHGTARFSFASRELFPHGFGQDTTPFGFESAQAGRAEFAIDDGGMVVGLGVVFQDGTKRERTGKTVQQRAEVWFTKQ